MRPADLTPVARDVMKLPASGGLMFASLLAAYLFAVLPWSGTWLLVRPDLVLLLLIFWTLHEPGGVGQGVAFGVGLLMDVSDSMLLGQHAFAYVVAVYGAQVLRVRILSFRLPEQTLHVLGLVFASSGVMLLLNLLLGADFPGFAYFVSPA
ncbi:MAG TPA: rod shape-determining protein MreD, partial [Usitatibacter sp.]|nr:rod shape-determining protein MreD [Usitatibacter sp.]